MIQNLTKYSFSENSASKIVTSTTTSTNPLIQQNPREYVHICVVYFNQVW